MSILKKTVVFTLLASSAALSCAETITMRADSWYPFNGEPGAKKLGYMIEVAQKAFEGAGHKLDYQLMDWDESVVQVQQGKIACIPGILKSEAPDLIYPELRLGSSDIGFFAKSFKLDWKYDGVDSFKGLTIGVVEDYSYDTNIDAYIKQFSNSKQVFVASGEEPLATLITKLEQGEIDLVLENASVFIAQSRKMKGRLKFEQVDALGDAEDLFIACSANNDKSKLYVKLLDKTLAEMRSSGELKKLLKKYGLKDWEN